LIKEETEVHEIAQDFSKVNLIINLNW